MTRTIDWPWLRLRAFAALTITATAVISFNSVKHLAELAGFGWLSWLFPLCLDAVAAFGMEIWLRRGAGQYGAAMLALSAVAASLLANIADHWITTGSMLAAVLGAAPPAMLAALLVVAHRHGTARPPVEVVNQENGGPDRGTEVPAPIFDYASPIGPMPVQRVDGIPVPPLAHLAPVPRATGQRPNGQVPPTQDRPQSPTPPHRLTPRMPENPPPPPPARTPAPAVPAQRSRPQVSAKVLTDDEIVAALRASGTTPTKRSVMQDYGIGTGRALRILHAYRGEQ